MSYVCVLDFLWRSEFSLFNSSSEVASGHSHPHPPLPNGHDLMLNDFQFVGCDSLCSQLILDKSSSLSDCWLTATLYVMEKYNFIVTSNLETLKVNP